jgi:acyl-CoA thioesterase FadM
MEQPLPESCRISTEVRVMYFDTDAGGVVHNIVYLRFIETARTLLAIPDGNGFCRDRAHGHPCRGEPGRRSITSVPPSWGMSFASTDELSRWSGVRFWVEFEIVRPADSALLVKCRQALALVQMPAGKPVRLPDGFPATLAFGSAAR